MCLIAGSIVIDVMMITVIYYKINLEFEMITKGKQDIIFIIIIICKHLLLINQTLI